MLLVLLGVEEVDGARAHREVMVHVGEDVDVLRHGGSWDHQHEFLQLYLVSEMASRLRLAWLYLQFPQSDP